MWNSKSNQLFNTDSVVRMVPLWQQAVLHQLVVCVLALLPSKEASGRLSLGSGNDNTNHKHSHFTNILIEITVQSVLC